MDVISGKVKVKTVKGERYALLVPEKGKDEKQCWYSAFVNERTSEELKNSLTNVQTGDEIELHFFINKSGFKSIAAIVPVIQTKLEPGDHKIKEPDLPAELEPEKYIRVDMDIQKIVGTSTSYAVPMYVEMMKMVPQDNELYGIPDWPTLFEIVEKISRAQIEAIDKLSKGE